MPEVSTVTATDGTKLHVMDHPGSAPAVVLISCWPMDHSVWDPQIVALQNAGHRVIAYDRRGFGRSEHAPTGYDYDTLADDLHTIMTELDVRDATLVGFSMGGGEVARYVARHGTDRVRSAVLVAAVTPYLLLTDDNPDGGFKEPDLQAMLKTIESDRDGFFQDFINMFYSARGQLCVTDAERAEAIAIAQKGSLQAILGCANAWATTDFRDDLKAMTVPLCVIHGNADAAVPFEVSGQRVHDMVPGSTLHIIDGGPHGLSLSHKAELSTLLTDWVARAAAA